MFLKQHSQIASYGFEAPLILNLIYIFEIKHPMDQNKIVFEINRELGLNFTENNVSILVSLLEAGMSPENMVKMLEDIKTEMATIESKNTNNTLQDSIHMD